MNTPPLELHIQHDEPLHPALTPALLTQWVQTALTEAVAVYTEANMAVPFHKVALVLRFSSENEAHSLNARYRQKDYATNVLTFEYGIDEQGRLSGDIIICTAVLEEEALEQHKPFLHHAAHLCVHGVLHALGYDHIDDDDAYEMEAVEVDILRTLSIPNPYQ